MLKHVVGLARSGQLRFRAETFGLYLPETPDRRPWWRISIAALRLLFNQAPSYRSWRAEMENLRRGGAHEWWGRAWPAIDLAGEVSRMETEDGPDRST